MVARFSGFTIMATEGIPVFIGLGQNMAKQSQAETHYENGGEVSKTDAEHRIVGGWFSVFKLDGEDVVDSDNEVIDIESYREAAIDFVKSHRTANFHHEQGEEPRGTLIDSLLVDSEEFAKMLVNQITGIPMNEIPVRRLGHFGSFQIHDPEDFEKVRNEGAMFSIEGQCDRVKE